MYRVAGFSSCPYYTKATQHAEYVRDQVREQNLSDVDNFDVYTLEFPTRDGFFQWLDDHRQEIKAPESHRSSPAIWREARGGTTTFVGGLDKLSMDIEVQTGGRTWPTSGVQLTNNVGRVVISKVMLALAFIYAVVLLIFNSPKEYRWYISTPITIAVVVYGQLVVSA